MAVEEEKGGELCEQTWLSEFNIEKAIDETILESSYVMQTLQEAIEDKYDAEDANKGASNVITASVMAGSGLEATTEMISAGLVAGEVAIGRYGISPAWVELEMAGGMTMAQYEHVTTAGAQQAVDYIDPEWPATLYCDHYEDGRERQEPPLPASHTPESLDHGQGSMTTGQQALHVARQCMQISHTDAEICQVVCTLAVALGASRNRRTEAGTIKALHAVLRLLQRPEMSEEEACTSTGASTSSFKRWHKRVQSAQLGVSLP